MLKRYKLLFTLMFIVLTVFALFACEKTVEVSAIEIVDDGYIKQYTMGEELNLSGMKVKIIYSNGDSKTVDVNEIRKDITVLHFDSTKEYETLSVKLIYKEKSAAFDVTVLSSYMSQIKFTVTFDTNGGSPMDSIEVSALSVVPMPASDPVKADHYFIGWYKEATLTNRWDFNTQKITADTNLYAKWGKYLTVTFSAPESGLPDVKRTDVKEGETYDNRPNVPERSGYIGVWDYNGEWNDLTDKQIVYAKYTPIQYQITFYFQNQNDIEVPTTIPMTFTVGQNANVLAANYLVTMSKPTKNHYHISGYKLRDSGTVLQDYRTYLNYISSDLHIVAVYELDTFTVTFDMNYTGGSDKEAVVPYGNRISESAVPQVPARENYVFDGWFADESLTQRWDYNAGRITGETRLYAKWTRLYTFIFTGYGEDGDNGSDTKTVYVRIGGTVTPPAIKEKVGYTAVWDRVSFDNITDEESVVTVNPVYSINNYTVKFTNFDGTVLTVKGKETQTVAHGTAAEAPETLPTRPRYNFLRWNVDFSVVTSNLVVVAEFTPVLYTVSFVTNSDLIKNPTEAASGSLLSPESLSLNGYDFDGWFKDSNLTRIWNVLTDTIESDTVLYAKWTKIHTLVFRYKYAANPEEWLTAERRVRNNEKLTNIPVMDEIAGQNAKWVTEADGQDVNFASLIVVGNMAFKASYQAAKYTVTFRNEGVDFYIVTNVLYGDKVSAPQAIPTKAGHVFNRWSNNPALTPIEKNTYFDAVFDILTFRVRFIDSFDSENPVVLLDYKDTTAIKYMAMAAAPANPEHEGYRFTGWDKDNSSITGDVDIYAKFEKKTYTVNFVTEYNNYIWASYIVEHGDVAISEVIPTRTGYEFYGWDYDYSGVTSNMRIKAIFVKKTYYVTLDANGGSLNGDSVVNGLYNTKLTRPADPAYAGKAFLGWYLDRTFYQKYDFNTLLISDFTLYARWEDYINGSEGIVYSLMPDGSAYVVSSAPENSNYLIISNYYNEKPVVSIASEALDNMPVLRSVILPNTLKTISASAFFRLPMLTSVTIPAGVTEIGENAFAECTALTEVIFESGSSLSKIGRYAFSNNSSLKTLVLPAILNEIDDFAFYACTSLNSIEIPSSVNRVGEKAFAACTGLKYARFLKITPPTMPAGAFEGRSPFFRIYVANLAQYNSTTSNTSGWLEAKNAGIIFSSDNIAGDWAYQMIQTGENAGKVKIIQYIGNASAVIPGETLTIGGQTKFIAEIGDYAFDATVEFIALNSDYIIGSNTLTSASGLKHLSVKITEEFNINKVYIREAFGAINSLTELTVSAAGLTMSEFFFNGVPATLKTVNILAGATALPDNMFRNCQDIEKITLPSGLISIGEGAFSGASALRTLEINGTALQTIGKNAFLNTTSLGKNNGDGEGMTIPSTVKSIGADAMKNSKYLSDITDPYVILGDGILYLYRGTDRVIVITRDVKIINDYAFAGNTVIRSVVFDSAYSHTFFNITAIKERAFEGCVSLEHVIMPASLAQIGKYAFSGASKLSKLILFSDNPPVMDTTALNGVMAGIEVYVQGTGYTLTAPWNGYAIVSANMKLFDNWVISYETSVTLRMVQYYGNSDDVTLNARFNDGNADRTIVMLANYAFTRSTTTLSLSAAILDAKPLAFGGLTKLRELTLKDTAEAQIKLSKTMMYQLLTANTSLSTLNISGKNPLKTVFNDYYPPAHLTTVRILDGETSIAEGMFRDCINVVNIVVPASVRVNQVGANAFTGSGWDIQGAGDFLVLPYQKLLVEYNGSDNIVVIPNTPDIVAVNRGVFRNNNEIENIYIDSNIINIYSGAFYNMAALTKVFINSAQAPLLDGNVFSGNAGGFQLFVTPSAYSQYNSTFYNNVDKVSNNTIVSDEYLYRPVTGGAELLQYFGQSIHITVPATIGGLDVVALGNNVYMKDTESLVIDALDTTTAYTFANLYTLREITIENTVSPASGLSDRLYSAINNNPNLTKFNYSGNVKLMTLLGNRAPASTLKEIHITVGSDHIVEGLLMGCAFIEVITLPDTVNEVGIHAFEDTAWFAAQQNFVIILDGLLYKYKGTDPDVIIPASVKTVNNNAFVNYVNGVWTGNARVQSIKFELGSQASQVKGNAFYDCRVLQNIDVPASMRYIDPSAFTGTRITVNSTTKMLIAVGSSSSMLIRYEGTAASVVIPATVKYINAYAFEDNIALTTLAFAADSLISIIHDNAFYGCTSLINVTLPKTIVNIAANAFSGTPWFTSTEDYIVRDTTSAIRRLLLYTGSSSSITIGEEGGPTNDITVIASGAFQSIAPGYTVTMHFSNPVKLDPGALDGAAEIYVPAEHVENYKTAWPQYKEKILSIV